MKRITDDDVLAAIVDLAGDGYCLVPDLFRVLPRLTHADRRRALNRAVNKGLVLERPAPLDAGPHTGKRRGSDERPVTCAP
jgi:hypothetical protein